MRAAQIREVRETNTHAPVWQLTTLKYKQPFELVEVPVPSIKSNQLLVRVHAAGFCHSDVQVLNGQFSSPLPLIPSHEPAGVIVEVGSAVSKDSATAPWKVGDRVGVLNFKSSCGSCTGCAVARRRYGGLDPRFCEKRETAGFHHDGAFAEYLVADPATTVRLPDDLSYEQAAPLMCAGVSLVLTHPYSLVADCNDNRPRCGAP